VQRHGGVGIQLAAQVKDGDGRTVIGHCGLHGITFVPVEWQYRLERTVRTLTDTRSVRY
jgi:hypothetical protein